MNLIDTLTFISINEKNGRLLCSKTFLFYGVSGMALALLARLGKIRIKGRNIEIVESSSTGDAILDEVLGYLTGIKTTIKINTTISRIPYRVKRLGKRLFENLEDNGRIRIDQIRFLGLIPYNSYVVTRLNEHNKLVKELKEILLKNEKRTDPEKALLITILHACGVMVRLFDKDERRQVKCALKKVGKSEFFETLDDYARAVNKAIKTAISAASASIAAS